MTEVKETVVTNIKLQWKKCNTVTWGASDGGRSKHTIMVISSFSWVRNKAPPLACYLTSQHDSCLLLCLLICWIALLACLYLLACSFSGMLSSLLADLIIAYIAYLFAGLLCLLASLYFLAGLLAGFSWLAILSLRKWPKIHQK